MADDDDNGIVAAAEVTAIEEMGRDGTALAEAEAAAGAFAGTAMLTVETDGFETVAAVAAEADADARDTVDDDDAGAAVVIAAVVDAMAFELLPFCASCTACAICAPAADRRIAAASFANARAASARLRASTSVSRVCSLASISACMSAN